MILVMLLLLLLVVVILVVCVVLVNVVVVTFGNMQMSCCGLFGSIVCFFARVVCLVGWLVDCLFSCLFVCFVDRGGWGFGVAMLVLMWW